MPAESVRALLASLTGATGESAEEVYSHYAGLTNRSESLETLVRRKLAANGKAANIRESLLGTLLANGAGSISYLTTATGTSAITSLAVAATSSAVTASEPLKVVSGSHVLSVTATSSGAAKGATSIPIASVTPPISYPAGSFVWAASAYPLTRPPETVLACLLRYGLVGWQ